MSYWRIEQGDALTRLRAMPDEFFQCAITSPPYFGLRDYGVEGQIGLEPTPDEYVEVLIDVFREVRRVLRDDGTLWLNLGDSYNNRSVARPSSHQGGLGFTNESIERTWAEQTRKGLSRLSFSHGGLKEKDLLGIPWMVAFALRADGWYLRDAIVWHKPNPMPSSQRDRCTSAYEHVFMFAKCRRYFYDLDAIREPDKGTDHRRSVLDGQPSSEPTNGLMTPHAGLRQENGRNGQGATKRNVWTVATQPFPDAHFAVFPTKLIEPMILAGTSPCCCAECWAPWRRVVSRTPMVVREGPTRQAVMEAAANGSSGKRVRVTGTMLKPATTTTGWEPTCEHDDGSGRCVVLDPFAGAGTTGLVALQHRRDFVGIELSSTYVEMARERIMRDELDDARPWPLSDEAQIYGESPALEIA